MGNTGLPEESSGMGWTTLRFPPSAIFLFLDIFLVTESRSTNKMRTMLKKMFYCIKQRICYYLDLVSIWGGKRPFLLSNTSHLWAGIWNMAVSQTRVSVIRYIRFKETAWTNSWQLKPLSPSSLPFSFPRSFRSFLGFFGKPSSGPEGPETWLWPVGTTAPPAALELKEAGVWALLPGVGSSSPSANDWYCNRVFSKNLNGHSDNLF